jgi:hypothetical protein
MICDGWERTRPRRNKKDKIRRSPITEKGREGEGAIASTRGACVPLSQRARLGVLFDLDCSVFDTEDAM